MSEQAEIKTMKVTAEELQRLTQEVEQLRKELEEMKNSHCDNCCAKQVREESIEASVDILAGGGWMSGGGEVIKAIRALKTGEKK